MWPLLMNIGLGSLTSSWSGKRKRPSVAMSVVSSFTRAAAEGLGVGASSWNLVSWGMQKEVGENTAGRVQRGEQNGLVLTAMPLQCTPMRSEKMVYSFS